MRAGIHGGSAGYGIAARVRGLGRRWRALIGLIGISALFAGLHAGSASASTDRERLEQRVLAARDVLLAPHDFGMQHTVQPMKLAQCCWQNWGNWGNWPNWNNWGNWANWFNR